MKTKIYKLKKDMKYTGSNNDTFMQYTNKRKLQKALDKREELLKKYHERYKKPSVLWLVLFYYGFIALVVLLSKCGF